MGHGHTHVVTPIAGCVSGGALTDLVERLVPGGLWTLFRRVVPPVEVIRAQGSGRRRRGAGDGECLAAIIFGAVSGCSWRRLPPVFGPAWPTVYRRFARWSQDGVWVRLHRVILESSVPACHVGRIRSSALP
jgi:transposase